MPDTAFCWHLTSLGPAPLTASVGPADPTPNPQVSMAKERAIDAARKYKQRFLQNVRRKSQPAPLAGLRQHRCEQYIYLKLSDGEAPREQRKAVFAHWKEMARALGGLPAGV